MDDFKLIIEAAIAKAKSDANINKYVKEIQGQIKDIELDIKVSDGNVRSAIKEVNKELLNTSKLSQNAFKIDEGKAQAFNKIGTYISKNSKLTKDQVSQFKELQTAINNVSDKSGLDKINTRFRTMSSEMESLGNTGKNTFDQLKTNMGQFLNFFYGAGAIVGAIGSVKQLISTTVELDKSYVALQQATGFTNEKTKELLNTYIDMGQELGATGIEVADSANNWLRQGKSISDTNTLIKDSMILSKIGQIDSAESTAYLTTAMKGYGVAVNDVISVVDKLSSVDMASSTSAGGLAQAMAETATNANMAGISMSKLLGYVALVGETTGESMSAVGQSFSTMFSRMGNIKLSRLVDPETGEDLSNVETSLHSVGIELREDDKTFRNFGDVLDDVAGRWKGYSSVTQRSIASSIAGKDHMEDFLVLMNGYGKATEYATVATNSSGKAMEKFSNYEQSVEAKTKRIQASLEELATDTLNSGVVKGFLDAGNAIVNFTDSIGLFNVALAAGFIALTKFSDSGLTKLLVGLSQSIKSIGLSIVSKTADTTATIAETAAINANTTAQEANAVTTTAVATASKEASVGMTMLGTAMDLIPLLAVVAGITLLVKGISEAIVTTKEHIKLIDDANQKYEESTSTLASLNTELATTQDKINELNSLDKLTFTQESELENLKKQNDELERSIELEKVKQNLAAQSTVSEIGNTYGSYKKKYGDMSSYETDKQSIQSYVDLTNTAISNPEKYSGKEDLLTYVSSKQKELDNWNGQLNNLKSEYLGYATQLEDWIAMYEKLGVDNLTASQKDVYTGLKSDLDNIYKKVLSASEYKKVVLEPKFNIVFDDASFSKAKSQLEDMAKSGELTPEVISSNEEYQKLLTNTGLTAQEVSDQINALVTTTDDVATSVDDTAVALQELNKAFTAFSSSDKALSDLKSEVKDFGAISISTINSLMEKYPQLTDVLYDYLSGMASTKDVINSLTGVYKTDQKNWETLLVSKYENDANFRKQVGANDANLINTMKDQYKIDLSNNKTLYEDKMDILNTYLGQAGGAWLQYYDIASGKTQNLGGLSAGDQYYISKQATLANQALATFNKGLDFSGVESNFKKANGDFKTSKTDKSDKTTKTELPEKYVSKRADLEHDRAMGLKDKDYYARLLALEGKYLTNTKNNRKKYKNEIWSIDESIYKHKQDLLEKAKEKELKDLKAQYDNLSDIVDKTVDKYSELYGLIDDKASSQTGTTQINSYTEGIKSAEQEVKYLEKEIENLGKRKISDAFTQDDYDSQLSKLQSALKDAKSSIDDFYNSIADSVKNSQDNITDSLDKSYTSLTDKLNDEKDAYDKIIQAQKDLIDLKEKQADYEKSIASKTSDIADIESRMVDLKKAASTGDREANSELLKLNKDLKDKQEDLTDTQHDHEIDLQKDALDNSLDNFNDIKDQQLKDAQTVYNDKLDKLKTLYAEEEKLIAHASEYTTTEFSTRISSLTGQINDIISQLNTATGGNVSGISGGDVKAITDAQSYANTKGQILSVLGSANGTGAGSSDLNQYVQSKNYKQLSYANMADLASIFGISGVTADSIKTDTVTKNLIKTYLMKYLEGSTFTTGGLASSMNEDGWGLIKRNELILDQNGSKIFTQQVAPLMNDFVNKFNLIKPDLTNITARNNSPSISITIPIQGNATQATVTALNSASNNIVKQIMNEVRKL